MLLTRWLFSLTESWEERVFFVTFLFGSTGLAAGVFFFFLNLTLWMTVMCLTGCAMLLRQLRWPWCSVGGGINRHDDTILKNFLELGVLNAGWRMGHFA